MRDDGEVRKLWNAVRSGAIIPALMHGSHQNSEVKRAWARVVLGWVTSWEVLVLHPIFFPQRQFRYLHFTPIQLFTFCFSAHLPFFFNYFCALFFPAIWSNHLFLKRNLYLTDEMWSDDYYWPNFSFLCRSPSRVLCCLHLYGGFHRQTEHFVVRVRSHWETWAGMKGDTILIYF